MGEWIPMLDDLNHYTIFQEVPLSLKEKLVEALILPLRLRNTSGCMLGMAVGDSLGPIAPRFFRELQDRPLGPHFDFERFEFVGAYLECASNADTRTSSTAMGLCMADSLLMRREFDGSDMRIRFWCWWNRGYNNAFRKELLSVERKGASMARKIACDSLQRAAESTQLQ
ncbi:hypothetical protein AK812_SmicGene43086 [Symbiodinium microadriaticum]|uniref:Uncharacterized protein n=1 Tax=Symbiodinium microadriaticum TaxID=2951 RepID=A0A1Q9C1X8_SYMMI|nr:hypothetical protein AK812_SmicGene43086 [Symbiodinium microadriaticum]